MPVLLIGPLTTFLCTASLAATGWPSTASTWMLNIVLAALLVMQFRLWDDLSDVDSDRGIFPERVLCQAKSLVGFRIVLGLLFAVNVILLAAYKSELALITFLVLNFLVFAWYSVRERVRIGSVFSQTIVLLKYPAFVFLLGSHAGVPERMLNSSYSMSLTILCFCIYELLHDNRVGPIKYVQKWLMIEMAAMILIGILMLKDLMGRSQMSVFVQIGLVVMGIVVLARLFQRFRNQVPPGRWCYAVFLVGFVWLLNFALSSYPGGAPRAIASSLPTFRDHTRIEVSMDLNEANAISPLKRGEGSKHKDVGNDGVTEMGVDSKSKAIDTSHALRSSERATHFTSKF